ncbi:MAG TPA: CAP domain-containing protein [Candidatus Paceibacterota bacterium]|nr:CAP domain-containing protein [Candidatus Paceibacterota bacterium]
MKKTGKRLKKYFIPHEENGMKPQILRPRTVAFVIVIALVVEGMFMFGSSYLAPKSKLFGIILVNALVDGTNSARVSDGLPSLQESPLLDEAAQEKANDMVANNYFAHTSPSGISPWYWFVNVGYNFEDAGENLAVNFADSSDVTNAWLNSPEHRANILDTDYTQIGMATAQGTYDGSPAIYVVELFGTPAPAEAAVASAPASPVAAATPKPKAAPVPTVPAVVPAASTANATGGGPVAVEGAQIQTLPMATTGTAPGATPTPASAAALTAPVSQANLIQTLASAPRTDVDYLYLAIAVLFGIALLINVFIKIRVQYPSLIFGGMLVILIAGMLIVLNQHLMLSGATVL